MSPIITNKYQPGYHDYYGYEQTHDDTRIINGAPTKSQQIQLADYAITLVNSYRKQQGLNDLIFGEDIQDATLAEVKIRNAEKKDFEHISFNQNELAPFQKKNLYLSSENLGYFELKKPTMLYAKVKILNIITAMIYQDGSENNGHRVNFERSIGMGMALQYNPKFTKHPYQVVFEGVGDATTGEIADSQAVSNNTFNTAPLYAASEILALRRNDSAKFTRLERLKKSQIKESIKIRKKQSVALNKVKKSYQKKKKLIKKSQLVKSWLR